MATVDWAELNSSKSAAKSYESTNVSIIRCFCSIDYSDFKNFSPSSLDDINDLNFGELKWEDIDYSTLNDASKEAIDWAQVDLKKATKSNTFDSWSIGQN